MNNNNNNNDDVLADNDDVLAEMLFAPQESPTPLRYAIVRNDEVIGEGASKEAANADVTVRLSWRDLEDVGTVSYNPDTYEVRTINGIRRLVAK